MKTYKLTALFGLLLILFVSNGLGQDTPCSALVLSYGESGIGDNSLALPNDEIASCFSDSAVDSDIWWSFEAASTGAWIYTSDVSLGNSDTQLAIYSSSDNTCVGKFTAIACNDDISTTNWMSSAKACGLVPGDTYYVQVDGWAGARGGFQIDMVDSPNCVVCDPTGCEAGEFSVGESQELCPGEFAPYSISGFSLPEDPTCPASGAMLVLPTGNGSIGGPFNGGGFIWTNPDLSGQLDYISSISFEGELPLEGPWEFKPVVFIDGGLLEICDEVTTSIKINFLSSSNPNCIADTTCN
ncbi:MAG: hypothetical protein HKO93_00580, partial [Flavobacteriales bacterium]|nr:hypothetical protein [Flavobacteriales bacterium]